MTDDPTKKQNQQPSRSGHQPSQQNQDKAGQQRDKSTNDVPRKRPSQGGYDAERDKEPDQEQGGQRRASSYPIVHMVPAQEAAGTVLLSWITRVH